MNAFAFRAFSALLVLPAVTMFAQIVDVRAVNYEAVGSGTYVERNTDHTYGRESGTYVGQIHNRTDPFWFYRAFMVFDVPKFESVVTNEDLGAAPDVFGGTLFNARFTGPALTVQQLLLFETPIKDVGITVRLSLLPADGLIDNTLNAEAVFPALSQGLVVGQHTFLATDMPSDNTLDYFSIPLPGLYSTLNQWQGGKMVLSVEMPFLVDYPIDRGDGFEFVYFGPNQGPYNLWLSGNVEYSLVAPVPEPASYGLITACLLIGGLLARRARRPDTGRA